jgi:hypothetical protein
MIPAIRSDFPKEETMAEKTSVTEVKSNFLLDCKCGFEAGRVGYAGGRSERWEIRCTNSKCPANVAGGSKERAIELWNEMQSNELNQGRVPKIGDKL